MKVACLVAAYKREKILDLCLKSLKQQTHPIDVFVVGSNKEEEEVVKENGCFFIHSENKPLSNKWQKGVDFIKEKNVYDALMIVGSDDLLSKKYVEKAIKHTPNFSLIGKSQWFILRKSKDYKSNIVDNLYELKYDMPKILEPLGSGRVYSKAFLDKINWKLFFSGENSLLDTHAFMKIFSLKEKFLIINESYIKNLFDYTLLSFPFFLGMDLQNVIDQWDDLKNFYQEEEALILSIKDSGVECINSFEDIKTASSLNDKIKTLTLNQINGNIEKWIEKYFGEDICVELLD